MMRDVSSHWFFDFDRGLLGTATGTIHRARVLSRSNAQVKSVTLELCLTDATKEERGVHGRLALCRQPSLDGLVCNAVSRDFLIDRDYVQYEAPIHFNVDCLCPIVYLYPIDLLFTLC
jgi:hypothetical protein